MTDNANTLLRQMLDTAESQPERKRDVIVPANRIRGYPFESAEKMREFHTSLQLCEKAQAIRLEWEKYNTGTQLSRVRLLSAQALAGFLDQPLRQERIDEIMTSIDSSSLPAWIAKAGEYAASQWRRGKRAFKLSLGESYRWPQIIAAATVLDSGLPNNEPMDYRQFGARYLGDSKLTRTLENAIAALFLWHWQRDDLTPQDVLSQLNLQRLEQPILLRGPMEVCDRNQVVSADIRPYIGFPSSMLHHAKMVSQPDYCLTIENLSSFLDHAKRIDDNGIILYTAGYPTSALQQFYKMLCQQITAPIFHWGDTDLHGFQIFKVFQTLVPDKPIKPHLMDVAAGDAYPKTEINRLTLLANNDYPMSDLIKRICIRGVGRIEQEILQAESPLQYESPPIC